MKMNYKQFESYGVYPEDIRVDVYDVNLQRGVKISITSYDISVSCHSEKSQVKNRDKCVEYILLILEHIRKGEGEHNEIN